MPCRAERIQAGVTAEADGERPAESSEQCRTHDQGPEGSAEPCPGREVTSQRPDERPHVFC